MHYFSVSTYARQNEIELVSEIENFALSHEDDASNYLKEENSNVRPNPLHASDDTDVVRKLIRANPWGILVSDNNGELIASHYPFLLDDDADELAVVTHLGRPDDRIHRIGTREVLLIIQGNHGYISPSWYAPGAIKAPTWNFSVVHCYGVPEVLDTESNLKVLTRLVEHFESLVDSPIYLEPKYARTLIDGTVGVRIPISRYVCKEKLSQDKDRLSQDQVVQHLRTPGPYANDALADDMVRVLSRAPRSALD